MFDRFRLFLDVKIVLVASKCFLQNVFSTFNVFRLCRSCRLFEVVLKTVLVRFGLLWFVWNYQGFFRPIWVFRVLFGRVNLFTLIGVILGCSRCKGLSSFLLKGRLGCLGCFRLFRLGSSCRLFAFFHTWFRVFGRLRL